MGVAKEVVFVFHAALLPGRRRGCWCRCVAALRVSVLRGGGSHCMRMHMHGVRPIVHIAGGVMLVQPRIFAGHTLKEKGWEHAGSTLLVVGAECMPVQ